MVFSGQAPIGSFSVKSRDIFILSCSLAVTCGNSTTIRFINKKHLVVSLFFSFHFLIDFGLISTMVAWFAEMILSNYATQKKNEMFCYIELFAMHCLITR